jgi:hypothetical protein
MTKSSGVRAFSADCRPRARTPKTVKHDDAVDEAVDEATASAEMAKKYLCGKYVTGQLQATEVAALSWHLAHAGLDCFAELMLDPLDPAFTKHASRKVRKALRMDEIERSFSCVETPTSESDERLIKDLPMVPIADALTQEFCKRSSTIIQQTKELGIANWLDNTVRLEALDRGYLPVPYGMFVDGAPWKGKGPGTNDAVVNYFVSFLGDRHVRRVVFSIRKDWLCGTSCGCPCRGRCSLDVIEAGIQFHANWAAEGLTPTTDVDLRPWTEGRISQPFLVHEGRRVVFVLIEFRADWDQYAAGMGMPKHNQPHFCWAGPCRQERMHRGISCWGHDEFMQAIQSCRIRVLVSYSAVQLLWSILKFDFRKKRGMNGRCISKAIDVLDFGTNSIVRLLPFDRLERGGAVRDIHCRLSELRGRFPFRLFFWRRPANMDFTFFSKLMEIVGFRYEYLTIDTMHTLDLGPAQVLIGHTMISVLKSEVLGNKSTEEGMKQGCRILVKQMGYYYKKLAKHVPSASKVSNLTLKMLKYAKCADQGSLKCKAAESRHLVPFAFRLLRNAAVSQKLGIKGKHLKCSIGCLIMAYRLMRNSGRRIDSEKLTQLLEKCNRHARRAGVNRTPKFHLMRHLGPRSKFSGNPWRHSAYVDESKNKDVVRLAQSAHVADFNRQLLCKDRLACRDL